MMAGMLRSMSMNYKSGSVQVGGDAGEMVRQGRGNSYTDQSDTIAAKSSSL